MDQLIMEEVVMVSNLMISDKDLGRMRQAAVQWVIEQVEEDKIGLKEAESVILMVDLQDFYNGKNYAGINACE